jgi:hypothetical protein
MTDLPPPNPAVGEAAAEEAAAARRDVETQLKDGTLKLTDVVQMSEAEATTGSRRVAGHMHLRAVLLALPRIGEKHADEILGVVGVEGSRHVDSLGPHQVEAIEAEVAARQATSG